MADNNFFFKNLLNQRDIEKYYLAESRAEVHWCPPASTSGKKPMNLSELIRVSLIRQNKISSKKDYYQTLNEEVVQGSEEKPTMRGRRLMRPGTITNETKISKER